MKTMETSNNNIISLVNISSITLLVAVVILIATISIVLTLQKQKTGQFALRAGATRLGALLPETYKQKNFMMIDSEGKVSTERVPDVIRSSVPSGTIAVWYGKLSSIPAGWSLCNGLLATIRGVLVNKPNLQSKFIFGAENESSVKTTGGSASVVLTIANVPKHYHPLRTNFNGSDHGWNGTGTLDNAKNSSFTDRQNKQYTIKRNPKTQNGFMGVAVGLNDVDWPDTPSSIDIMPPYVKLHYIIKID